MRGQSFRHNDRDVLLCCPRVARSLTIFYVRSYSTFSIPLAWLANFAFLAAITFLLRLPDLLLFFRSQMPSLINLRAIPRSIFMTLPSSKTRPSDSILLR